MGDDTEFTKLPLEERCTHKLWKARLHGYSEASKLFDEEEDEKAPIFNQFVGLVSKFVGDTNAAAQEKGLEAVFYFVQNAAVASKTVKDVMSVIVAKCIAAPKAKTKDWAVQIALMYIEIEKQEQVAEELIKGMEHKNPKIVAACASALALCLKEFGSKVIAIKPIVKPVCALLEDRDKNVRDESKALVVEIYRWIKDAIKPQLSSLKQIHLGELETEFEKVKGEKATPTRYLRSQQVRQAKLAAEKEETGDTDATYENDTENCNVDPYDLMDPINVLSQIPSDFYVKLEAKKWQERKEAVDSLEKILDYPKFEKGDYSDFVRALLKVITKDSNVMVVGVAVKCMARLAAGLKKGFQPYAATVLPQLLEKFKEKKANVVTPLREAVDAIYPITTLEAIQEDVISSLESKNPAVKAETASFLARAFTKCTPTILNKKLLKALTTALLKTLNESDPTVRENSAEALGTAMKVVGEKAIMPFMPDIDNLKLSKIKECSDKAVVVKAQPPPPAPAKPAASKPVRSKSDAAPPAQKTPTKVNPPKKVASVSKIKKTATTPAVAKPVTKKKDDDVDTSPLMPVNNMKNQRILDEQKLKTLKWNFTVPRSEFVDLLKEQMTAAGFNKTLVANMFHSNFKLHLKAIDSLNDDLSNVDALVSNLDLILKWMTLRFFDTNPSVLLKGLDYLQNVFSLLIDNSYNVFDTEANSFIPYLVLKIGDPKDAVRDRVRAIFKQLSRMYPPGKIFTLVIEGLKTKNARQRTECLEELGNLIEEFGMPVCQPTPAAALKEISKQISDRDHSVRSAALNAIVKAWYIEGDKVYKLIGQISEKDLSLLEERIKRASKARPSIPAIPKHDLKEKEKEKEREREKEKEKEKSPESKTNTTFELAAEEEDDAYEPSPVSVPKPRPNAFEQNFFKDLGLSEPPIPKMDLIEIDDSFLNSPIQIPERIAAKLSKPSVASVVQPREDSEIDQVIRDLASTNINVAFHAASKLRLILESQVRSMLTVYTDGIAESLTTQLRLVNSYSFEKYGLILPQTYRMLFRIIDDIFGKKTSMGVAVKVGHLQNLLRELLITLVEEKTAKFEEGGYNKWINAFVSRIIEDSDHTNVTCAVLKLLYEVVGHPPENPKITDLTTKCLLKIIVLIKKGNSTWCEMLDLDEVFYECHLFFQAYPRHTWKDRPSIVPLKAVKTLLLTLVGLKGKDIFFYLKKIENPCASELASYLKRLLKTQPSIGKTSSSTRLSKATSDHLSEIFMKIAYEETAKEGLLQFYEFKKQNPHLDLSSFLAPTSQYFRDYVENGLKNIEKEKGTLKASSNSPQDSVVPEKASAADLSNIPMGMEGPVESGNGLAQYYLDKLRMFQARVGIHLTDLPDFKTDLSN